ncbi:MAG: FAD-dependent oxidoreductase, partial [Actinomycetota bacterium]
MPDSTIVAPCTAACPALTDVQGYVSLAALGRFAEAFEVARLTNPIAASCGYICFHPCEEKCRRTAVDETVSIMELKRAACTFGAESREQRAESKESAEHKIAVIGAGPAGLTAAQDLALAGASVTVYERENKAGGMLRQTIPAYRLPDEAIDRDIAAVEATGIKIAYGRELGKNLALDEIRANHDAVIVAAGLPESRSLPVFPSEGDKILTAISFLKDVKAGKPPVIKSRVIVVGGGNVAIDVARSAVRLGAAEVNLVCLEAREEMPAHDWEIEEAAAEGVIMNCCLGPAEVLGDAAVPAGLKCQAVKS